MSGEHPSHPHESHDHRAEADEHAGHGVDHSEADTTDDITTEGWWSRFKRKKEPVEQTEEEKEALKQDFLAQVKPRYEALLATGMAEDEAMVTAITEFAHKRHLAARMKELHDPQSRIGALLHLIPGVRQAVTYVQEHYFDKSTRSEKVARVLKGIGWGVIAAKGIKAALNVAKVTTGGVGVATSAVIGAATGAYAGGARAGERALEANFNAEKLMSDYHVTDLIQRWRDPSIQFTDADYVAAKKALTEIDAIVDERMQRGDFKIKKLLAEDRADLASIIETKAFLDARASREAAEDETLAPEVQAANVWLDIQGAHRASRRERLQSLDTETQEFIHKHKGAINKARAKGAAAGAVTGGILGAGINLLKGVYDYYHLPQADMPFKEYFKGKFGFGIKDHMQVTDMKSLGEHALNNALNNKDYNALIDQIAHGASSDQISKLLNQNGLANYDHFIDKQSGQNVLQAIVNQAKVRFSSDPHAQLKFIQNATYNALSHFDARNVGNLDAWHHAIYENITKGGNELIDTDKFASLRQSFVDHVRDTGGIERVYDSTGKVILDAANNYTLPHSELIGAAAGAAAGQIIPRIKPEPLSGPLHERTRLGGAGSPTEPAPTSGGPTGGLGGGDALDFDISHIGNGPTEPTPTPTPDVGGSAGELEDRGIEPTPSTSTATTPQLPSTGTELQINAGQGRKAEAENLSSDEKNTIAKELKDTNAEELFDIYFKEMKQGDTVIGYEHSPITWPNKPVHVVISGFKNILSEDLAQFNKGQESKYAEHPIIKYLKAKREGKKFKLKLKVRNYKPVEAGHTGNPTVFVEAVDVVEEGVSEMMFEDTSDIKLAPDQLSEEQSRAMLKNLKLEDVTFRERKLTPELIAENGLGPKYKIVIGGKKAWASSKTFDHDAVHRVGLLYSEDSAGVMTALPYVTSGSQGIYRFYPGFQVSGTGNQEQITWYAKGHDGHSEDSLSVPIHLQKVLAEVESRNDYVDLDGEDAELIMVGLTNKYTTEEEAIAKGGEHSGVNKNPLVISGIERHSLRYQQKSPAEATHFVYEEDKPDFNSLLDTWQREDVIYGKVTYEVFESKNGKGRFLFCRDAQGRAWIGAIEDISSPINHKGLKQQWIDGGLLTTPAYEYGSMTRDADGVDYGGRGYGDYEDMFERFLSRVPVIQEYLQARAPEQYREFLAEQAERNQIIERLIAANFEFHLAPHFSGDGSDEHPYNMTFDYMFEEGDHHIWTNVFIFDFEGRDSQLAKLSPDAQRINAYVRKYIEVHNAQKGTNLPHLHFKPIVMKEFKPGVVAEVIGLSDAEGVPIGVDFTPIRPVVKAPEGDQGQLATKTGPVERAEVSHGGEITEGTILQVPADYIYTRTEYDKDEKGNKVTESRRFKYQLRLLKTTDNIPITVDIGLLQSKEAQDTLKRVFESDEPDAHLPVVISKVTRNDEGNPIKYQAKLAESAVISAAKTAVESEQYDSADQILEKFKHVEDKQSPPIAIDFIDATDTEPKHYKAIFPDSNIRVQFANIDRVPSEAIRDYKEQRDRGKDLRWRVRVTGKGTDAEGEYVIGELTGFKVLAGELSKASEDETAKEVEEIRKEYMGKEVDLDLTIDASKPNEHPTYTARIAGQDVPVKLINWDTIKPGVLRSYSQPKRGAEPIRFRAKISGFGTDTDHTPHLIGNLKVYVGRLENIQGELQENNESKLIDELIVAKPLKEFAIQIEGDGSDEHPYQYDPNIVWGDGINAPVRIRFFQSRLSNYQAKAESGQNVVGARATMNLIDQYQELKKLYPEATLQLRPVKKIIDGNKVLILANAEGIAGVPQEALESVDEIDGSGKPTGRKIRIKDRQQSGEDAQSEDGQVTRRTSSDSEPLVLPKAPLAPVAGPRISSSELNRPDLPSINPESFHALEAQAKELIGKQTELEFTFTAAPDGSKHPFAQAGDTKWDGVPARIAGLRNDVRVQETIRRVKELQDAHHKVLLKVKGAQYQELRMPVGKSPDGKADIEMRPAIMVKVLDVHDMGQTQPGSAENEQEPPEPTKPNENIAQQEPEQKPDSPVKAYNAMLNTYRLQASERIPAGDFWHDRLANRKPFELLMAGLLLDELKDLPDDLARAYAAVSINDPMLQVYAKDSQGVGLSLEARQHSFDLLQAAIRQSAEKIKEFHQQEEQRSPAPDTETAQAQIPENQDIEVFIEAGMNDTDNANEMSRQQALLLGIGKFSFPEGAIADFGDQYPRLLEMASQVLNPRTIPGAESLSASEIVSRRDALLETLENEIKQIAETTVTATVESTEQNEPVVEPQTELTQANTNEALSNALPQAPTLPQVQGAPELGEL